MDARTTPKDTLSEATQSVTPAATTSEEIDITALLRKLFTGWRTLLRWTVVALVLGLVLALSAVRSYTVDMTLAPEVASRYQGMSGLSALAGLAGVNLNTIATSDAVYPDYYPAVVASAPFVVELLQTPVTFTTKKEGPVTVDYYTYLTEYTRSPWYAKVIGAPFKALGWFIGLFKEKPQEEPAGGASAINPESLTLKQAKVVANVRGNIGVTIDKKNYQISLSVSAQDPNVAFQIAQVLVANLKKYVVTYRTGKARDDLNYYQRLFDEAQASYYAAQQDYAHYVDANQGVVLQRVLTEGERLQNEVNLQFNLYNTCAQQLQMAQAKLQQETPVFAVITPPTRPLQASSSRLTKLILVTFLGFCFACAWILLKDSLVAFIDSLKTPHDAAEAAA